MKLALLLGLLGATSANANTMCLNFSTQLQYSEATAHRAQCEVTQSEDLSHLTGNWTCSFDGGAKQTLSNTWATWLSDADEMNPQALFYDIEPNQDLGDFLLSGLKISDVKMGVSLVVDLGQDAPKARYNGLSIIDNSWNFSYLTMEKSSYGKCQ